MKDYFRGCVLLSGYILESADFFEKSSFDFDKLFYIRTEALKEWEKIFSDLSKAFITPMDREDILYINKRLRQLLFAVQDCAAELYTELPGGFRLLKKPSYEIKNAVVACCKNINCFLKEFSRKGKPPLIKYMNDSEKLILEGEARYFNALESIRRGAGVFNEACKELHALNCLKSCMDSCMEVIYSIEHAIIKNT